MHSKDLIKLQGSDGRIDVTSIWPVDEDEGYGKTKSFCKTDDGVSIFWKSSDVGSVTDYGEVLASHLARQFGLRSAKYFFAKNRGVNGVISRDYRNKGETEILAEDFLADSYKEMVSKDIPPNTYDLNKTAFIEKTLKFAVDTGKMNKTDAETIFSNVLKMIMFDLAISNPDRHTLNWGILKCENNTRFIPVFDNGRCFNFYLRRSELIALYKDYANDPNQYNQKKIDQFYKSADIANFPAIGISENPCFYESKAKPIIKYMEDVKKCYPIQFNKLLKCFYNISFNKAIQSVEKETGVKIPGLIKTVAMGSYENRYKEIKEHFGAVSEFENEAQEIGIAQSNNNKLIKNSQSKNNQYSFGK